MKLTLLLLAVLLTVVSCRNEMTTLQSADAKKSAEVGNTYSAYAEAMTFGGDLWITVQ